MERLKTHEAQQRQTSVVVAEHNGLSIYNAINNYRESHIALMSRTNTHEVYENNFILSYVNHFLQIKLLNVHLGYSSYNTSFNRLCYLNLYLWYFIIS